VSRLTVQRFHQQAGSQLDLTLVSGRAGYWRTLESSKIQRPGLALTGFMEHFRADRLQVVGFSEVAYLKSLEQTELVEILEGFFGEQPPCVVITRGLEPPVTLLELADAHKVCVFTTPLQNSVFVDRAVEYLDDKLEQTTSLHGVLVDVMSVGVMLMGPSGVGKSEVALELINRGHRLVADDIIEVRKRPPDAVYGSPSDIIGHHMEIRGLGIINVRDLYGVTAVRQRKKIDLVVELVHWAEDHEYERLGVDDVHHTLLGVNLPKIVLPLRPGQVIATLVEVSARDRLLKDQGIHSARQFQERLSHAIAQARPSTWDGEEVE
jgi:HPr kinase/phosphorylase